jgi:ArsR family transcriptional regulator, arsenate/arsenite/antimonite-responsive transcriptional repressor
MKTPDALQALAALSHATRLEVFRLLLREGALGLPAGQIAERLEVAPSTLSPHLAQLERAGLVTSARDERRIIYAVNIEGMRGLLTYLTEECCGGHPEICGYPPRGAGHDDDLPRSELRRAAQCAGDDPECGRGAPDRRVREDTTDS